MSFAIYLKDKKNKIQHKYHHVTKRIESPYGLIYQKVTSKFHKEIIQLKLMKTKII
mgnify:CR=1 FL=1